jgi:holo-[acyl-carrier protein] synthase
MGGDRRGPASQVGEGSARVGVDIVSIERMRRLLARRPSAAAKVFTDAERADCGARADPPTHYAARFAVKEAARKAIGRPIGWHRVEVRSSRTGKPAIVLAAGVRTIDGRTVGSATVSIAHDAGVAIAVVIVEVI